MRVNNTPSFQATTALDKYLRVKLSSGKLVVGTATDDDLGTLAGAALAADDYVAVIPTADACVRKMVASAAITQYATVHTAAGGKVSSTAATGSFRRGIALEAASGDGSIINVLTQASTVPKPA